MPKTVFYSATSLDGFLADAQDSLEWLFVQAQDPAGPMNYDEFIAAIGAMVMGRRTYEWVVHHLHESGEPWPYRIPVWVVSHADLPPVPGADLRFAAGDVRPVHAALLEAAGERDVWVVGGGDLAGQFADAGLLDELVLYVAPVTLGAGRPLFPRAYALDLLEVERNQDFICARFRVLGPGATRWSAAAS